MDLSCKVENNKKILISIWDKIYLELRVKEGRRTGTQVEIESSKSCDSSHVEFLFQETFMQGFETTQMY